MVPPEEAAIRLLEKVEDQAADAIEFRDLDRYFVANGIDLLLEDLRPDFEEKRVHNIGELTGRYENLSRSQGESIHASLTLSPR